MIRSVIEQHGMIFYLLFMTSSVIEQNHDQFCCSTMINSVIEQQDLFTISSIIEQ